MRPRHEPAASAGTAPGRILVTGHTNASAKRITPKKRLVVGLSGASGAILCVSLLEAMRREKDWEVHLVTSEAGERVLREETGMSGRIWRGWPSARTDIGNIGSGHRQPHL